MATVEEMLAEVKRLDAEATKGPWRVGSVETWHVFSPSTHAEAMGPERVLLRLNEHFPHAADGALVAYYRTAAPSLAGEVERLQERVRVLEGALRPFAKVLGGDPDMVPDDMMCPEIIGTHWNAARAALEGIEVE